MMDYIGTIGLGMAFAANIAALAYQWSQISSKIDALETRQKIMEEEMREFYPVKIELVKVGAILERLETRFNNFFDRQVAELKKGSD